MLHELLFVLMGYSGDVFIPSPSNKATTFSIPSNFPLLHPTERACLNRLGQLGWIYSEINSFITSVKDYNNSPIKGSYVLALVTSMESTLNDYRQDILDMEQRILNKQDEAGSNKVPLSLLTANLAKWEVLLPLVYKLIQVLSTGKYHGCQLFDLLMEQAKTGIVGYRVELEKMIQQLYAVFYRQLTCWIIYGQLVDPHKEFFIYDNQQQGDNWNTLYIIKEEMIPSHLSMPIIESILFIGKAISTVNSNNDITLPKEITSCNLSLLTTLLYQINTSYSQMVSPWIRYAKELKLVVDEIRRSISDWLFKSVLIQQYGLHEYLKSFKQVFLLNDADLITNFIKEISKWKLNNNLKHSSKTFILFANQELNSILKKSCEDDNLLNGFQLHISETNTDYLFNNLLSSDLNIILTYNLEWPINLFLNDKDVKSYSQLWLYLTSLKSIQIKLNSLKSNKNIYLTRNNMIYFINTIWNHIQFNIIDVYYKKLLRSTTKYVEFDDIQVQHHLFLTNTLKGCLLYSQDCCQLLNRIFIICIQFCDFVETLTINEASTNSNKKRKTAVDIVNQWTHEQDDSWLQKLNTFHQKFNHATLKFFQLVSIQHPDTKTVGKLDILSMQLDYNKYFSSM